MNYNKMPSGYGIIQTAIMKKKDLSVHAKLIYSLLASMTGNKNYCWPSIKTICEYLDLSKTTVIKYLKELEEKNLIKKSKLFGEDSLKQNNKYEIMFIDESEPAILTPKVQNIDPQGAPSRSHNNNSLNNNNKNNNIQTASPSSRPVKSDNSKPDTPKHYAKIRDYIDNKAKKLGQPLNWKMNAKKYTPLLIKICNAESDTDIIKQKINDLARMVEIGDKNREWYKGTGLTPMTLLSNYDELKALPPPVDKKALWDKQLEEMWG